MKKILSFMLVLSMLLSMVSFAIPVAVEVESAAEVADIVETTPVSDDAATLSAEGDSLPATDIFVIDFEDQEVTPEGETISMGNYSGFPQSANGVYSQFASWYKENPAITLSASVTVEEETVDGVTNKYVRFKDYNTSRDWFVYNVFLDNGHMNKPGIYTYTVKYKTTGLDSFNFGVTTTSTVKDRVSALVADGNWQTFVAMVELKEGETISKLNLNFRSKDLNPFVQGDICLDDLTLHYEPFEVDEYGYRPLFNQDFESYLRTPEKAITLGNHLQLKGFITTTNGVDYFKDNIGGSFPVVYANGGSYAWNNQGAHKMSFREVDGNRFFVADTTQKDWNYFTFIFSNGSPSIIKPGDYIIAFDTISDAGTPIQLGDGKAYQSPVFTKQQYINLTSTTATVKTYFTIATAADTNKGVGVAVKFNNANLADIGIDNVKLWYREPAVAATVTFDANGVNAANMPTTYVGKTYDELDMANYIATAEGKVLVGWAKTPDGEVVSKFVPLATENTLYAIWADAKETSTITFNANGLDAQMPAKVVADIGGSVDLSLYPAKVNDLSLKFVGWSTTTDASGIIAGGIFTPTEAAHTLYAITEAAALVHPYFSTEFNEGDKVIFADGIGQVGGVDEYSKAHTVVNGFLRTTFTDLNLDKNGTWIEDPIQQHIYVTEDTPIVKDDIKGLVIAYKMNDTVYNGNWTGNTVNCNATQNKSDIFFGGAEATGDTGLKNLGDHWHARPVNDYYYYDFVNAKNWAPNWDSVPAEITRVRFDILQGAYDGLTYDLDYVKFVLADDRILPSIPAETEMALDGDYAVTFTYPQGLNVPEDEIAPDVFGKYAIDFEFVGENQIKVYVNPAYAWAGNVVPVKSPGFMNADGTMTYVTTYYNMAFETLGAPTTIDAAQIRTDADDTTKQGMRYAAYIESAAPACEYGFIVTLESSLDDGMGGFAYDTFYMDEKISYNGTAISGTNAYGVKLVGAVAITGTGAQTIYSTTGEEFGDYAIDEGLYFTTVLTNIPLTKVGVNTRFVGRPYVKFDDGTYVHGAPITRSLYDIAAPAINEALNDDSYETLDKFYQNIYMASLGIPVA